MGNLDPWGPVVRSCVKRSSRVDFLEDGVQQFDWFDCSEVLQQGNEDAVARLRALFPCGLANSCDELVECLDTNDPVSSCQSYCETLDECGLAADDCVDRCDARFFRSRDTAHRTCVSEAVGCEAVSACEVPAQLDCARLCTRVEECGLVARSARRCDDGPSKNQRHHWSSLRV